jgi:hypothetical protein
MKVRMSPETEPVIQKQIIEFMKQGMTLKEMLFAFQELGYAITSTSTLNNWKKKFGLVKENYRKSGEVKGNQNLGFIEDEIWKPIITEAFDASEYQISQYGNVLGKMGQKLKWFSTGIAKYASYMSVKLSLRENNYKTDFIPQKESGITSNSKKIPQTINVHRIVAELFLTKPVPLCFSELWPTLNKVQRDWIQSVYIVDHIDDDKSNPHVDNLRWVTPRNNNQMVKRAING